MNEEQKATVREWRYKMALLANVCGPLLGTALIAGGVKEWVALAVAAAGVVTGAAGNAMAAGKTKTQINDGTFAERAPEPVPIDLDEMVANGIEELVANATVATGRMNAVAKVAASVLPGVVAAGTPPVDLATAVDRAIAATREA